MGMVHYLPSCIQKYTCSFMDEILRTLHQLNLLHTDLLGKMFQGS